MIERVSSYTATVLEARPPRKKCPDDHGFTVVSPSNYFAGSHEVCWKATESLLSRPSPRVTVRVDSGFEYAGVVVRHDPVVVLSVGNDLPNAETELVFTSLDSLDAFLERVRRAGRVAFHTEGHEGSGI